MHKLAQKESPSKREQLYQKVTRPVFINKDISFIRVVDDLSRDVKYPDGIYYAFDFTHFQDQWDGVEGELRDLTQMQLEITDAWYQGEGSSCVNPKTNWSTFVKVYRQFYFRTNSGNENILNLGYKEVSEINFQCPFQIIHIIKENQSDNPRK